MSYLYGSITLTPKDIKENNKENSFVDALAKNLYASKEEYYRLAYGDEYADKYRMWLNEKETEKKE